MGTWTEERKAELIEAYKAAEPTPENTIEVIKEIAEEMGESPNGCRMILMQADVYVKTAKAPVKGKTAADGKASDGKRVSKESQIAALRKIIEDRGAEVDEEILDKMTGKAASYFVKVLESI